MEFSIKTLVLYFLILLLGVGAIFAIINFIEEAVPEKKDTIIFSPKTALSNTWQKYKKNHLEIETMRTLDVGQNNITTSEGQSYTMLRAVWIDDKETFDKSWQWTKDNLQRENDNLFSWLFGEKEDGTYGVLTEREGQNTASDADTDIAVALIFAYSRWNDADYLREAQKIVQDIWDKEVIIINGEPYLTATDVEKSAADDEIIINPSYISPYAYKMFAEIDPGNNWNDLVDSSYRLLEKSIVDPIDKEKSANIPPDWVAVNRNTGNITKAGSLDTKFSFDAMRIPWRLSLDWEWNQDPRAKRILERMNFFEKEWSEKKLIYYAYDHDGTNIVDAESPAIYGGLIGYFTTTDSREAQNIYEKKINNLYNPDTNSWIEPLGYYSENWAWFGFALYHELLPNLWATAGS